jgi:glycosyltransferase involved in cell wall biosynthesis
MRICMVLYDMQDLGGLEEYAVTLAIGLQDLGHSVSVLSTAWVPLDNQYKRRLVERGVPMAEVPKWISLPASAWDTKLAIVGWLMRFLTPLVYLLTVLHFLARRVSCRSSLMSARGWVRQHVMRIVGPDRRPVVGRALLRWWSYSWRPDLLHLHGYTTNLLFALEWAHTRQVPVVYEEHQTPDAQFDWWREFHRTINKATVVVAVSEKSANGLRDVCGVTRPITVRPPLMPDPVRQGHPQFSRPRAAGDLTVTSVARLSVAKGLNHLLEAMAAVRTTHPRTRFAIHGNGPLRAELRAQALQLGLDPDTLFPGAFTSREALAAIMAGTDIFVMSSILEGQPLSLVEAMAYGCPIVATSVGGIPELIQDGMNGLLCPPADPACLASKIRTAIEDPVLREQLGREARRSYEQGSFQPQAVCEHLLGIYAAASQTVTRSGT